MLSTPPTASHVRQRGHPDTDPEQRATHRHTGPLERAEAAAREPTGVRVLRPEVFHLGGDDAREGPQNTRITRVVESCDADRVLDAVKDARPAVGEVRDDVHARCVPARLATKIVAGNVRDADGRSGDYGGVTRGVFGVRDHDSTVGRRARGRPEYELVDEDVALAYLAARSSRV